MPYRTSLTSRHTTSFTPSRATGFSVHNPVAVDRTTTNESNKSVSWQGIHGHDRVVEQFRRALSRGRLASSFLFVGPPGIGKRLFAMKLAQVLLCLERPETAMDPCGVCPACVQVIAGSHPDLDTICKPPDKSFLPLSLLIGDKDHRRREGLCHNLSLKPFMGGRKVALIDDADSLNPEGANCLLKTLEEPPSRSCLILIGTSPTKQLPTIRSRCQLIRFSRLSSERIAELLLFQQLVEDPGEAAQLANASEGSLQQAAELADPDLWAFRDRLHTSLERPVLESVRLSQMLLAFVDEAGKEASARRARLRQIVRFAAAFYRQRLHSLSDNRSESERIASCLDRCLEAAEQIERNTHLTVLVECWLDDLARAGSPGRR